MEVNKMLFSSLIFITAFLPLFFLLYYPVRKPAWRNTLLFLFSVLFYAWGEPAFVLLMLFSLTVNYIFGLLIEKALPNKKRAKCFLILITVIDLGLLAVFKYTGFLVENLVSLTGLNIAPPKIPLPIGISFYTFQILSYVIDVYREEVPAQRNFIYLGAYLAAFPQLIAGPIVRYTDIAEELKERRVNADDIADGLRRFIMGLAKKVLIANNTALVADALFAVPADQLGAAGSWIAAIAYTLQIYYDFSGYSDMAIGMGRMMGFHYLENFNYPYASVSVTDFWRRWHMSLSSFFRDYVYIPLGGSRVSRVRWIFNTMVVWMLTGLWHGASWNFVVWGLYYGVFLLLEKLLFPDFQKKLPLFSWMLTMLATIIGWVVFRAETLTDAIQMYGAMFGAYGLSPLGLPGLLQRSGVGGIFLLAVLTGCRFAFPHKKLSEILPKEGPVLSDAISFVLLFGCFLSLAAQSYNPFIYFRF